MKQLSFFTVIATACIVLCSAAFAADDAEKFRADMAAAKKGDIQAQYNLGMHYTHGDNPDYVKAAKWFQKPAKSGMAEAQRELGIVYQGGFGMERDFKQAAKWIDKAARQDDQRAQQSLAGLYFHGNGVKLNYEEAYFWFSRAWPEPPVAPKSADTVEDRRAAITHDFYTQMKKSIEGHLKPEQLPEIKARAAAWKPATQAD
ncbi:MAG: sel1 repeat family protein [Alphaproteobacteria bacterium]|nr:MAG: sel1 repeat family protein [Alphaproteobacteria bacterium]